MSLLLYARKDLRSKQPYWTVARWITSSTTEQPIRLTNVDGTTNQAGRIERYCEMTIQSRHQRNTVRFYKTSLGEDRIIFGYPWLRTFNPQIDWEKGKVKMPWPK